MSQIRRIYTEQPSAMHGEIEVLIKGGNIQEEIEAFRALADDPSYEKTLFIFYVEILAKAVKKPADFTSFIAILLSFIDKNMSMKDSMVVLRSIRAVINTRFFIPLSFYLTKLMSLAMNIKNPKRIAKKFDYDHVRVSSDEAASDELQLFVIRECLILIKRHCYMLGSSIGFPEFATVVCNELKTHSKGIFRELISDLIRSISQRKAYIEEERNRLKINAMNGSKVLEFENSLKKWVIE